MSSHITACYEDEGFPFVWIMAQASSSPPTPTPLNFPPFSLPHSSTPRLVHVYASASRLCLNTSDGVLDIFYLCLQAMVGHFKRSIIHAYITSFRLWLRALRLYLCLKAILECFRWRFRCVLVGELGGGGWRSNRTSAHYHKCLDNNPQRT